MEKTEAYILLIIILIGTAISLVYFQGENKSFDDATYVHYANQVLNGTYNISSGPYAYGTLFIYSITISNSLAGSYFFPQLLEFIGLIICSYLLCRRYFGIKPSFLASVMLELSPFTFLYATRVLPDMGLAFLVAAGLCLIVYAEDWTWRFMGGFFLGATIFIKLGGAAFVGFIVIFYAAIQRRLALILILGAIIPIILYAVLLPNPLAFPEMLKAYSGNQASISVATLKINLLTVLATSIIYYSGSPAYFQVYPLGLILFLAFAGLILAAWKRNKDMALFAFIFFISYLWLFFGTESLSTWTYITVDSRYFLWFAPELCVLSAFFLDWLFSKKWAYSLRIILIAFFLLNLPLYIYFFSHRGLA